MGLLQRALELEHDLIINKGSLTGRLKTDIDRLYYIVRLRGAVKLADAARILSIAPENAEEYARILADQNLLIISRPLFGGTILESSEKKPS